MDRADLKHKRPTVGTIYRPATLQEVLALTLKQTVQYADSQGIIRTGMVHHVTYCDGRPYRKMNGRTYQRSESLHLTVRVSQYQFEHFDLTTYHRILMRK